ncbi:nucleolar transcription factor 1 [Malaya genurostris]|uniref:nucleolar transcription factor 1 n=1 Tax=Malaya genurostris TaxID=325434 RepID=UPI0026F3CE33|nr:nucleolar transcription factor 1 [Malaya genurostris]
MAEPSKDELRKEIAVILKDANLEETAAKKVRLQLEENLKCDLSGRKKEVDDLVMEYVNAQDESGEEDEEDDEEDEEVETKKAAAKKKAAAGGKKKKANSEDDEDDENNDDDDEEGDDDGSDDGGAKNKRGGPGKRGAPAKKRKHGSDSEEDSDGSVESEDDYKPKKGPKGSAKKARGKKKGGSDSDSDGDWKKAKPKNKKLTAAGTKRKSTGFTRPYTLSPELAAICGAESLPRHEVVKKVWAIIKERNLYDPKNKQFAICDSELQKVIGVKRFRTFGMLKYLKPHFLD